MARSTAGSPTTFNKPNESGAATKPTIMPRHNKDPVVIAIILNANLRWRARLAQANSSPGFRPAVEVRTAGALVAGEAEQMAAVVHEFMHVHALDDRSGAF